MDSIEQSIFNTVTDAIKTKKVNVSEVMQLVTFVMITVETYKQLSGQDKLARVIKVLKDIVNANGEDLGIPESVLTMLKQMLNNEEVLIGIINTIINATKRINIGGTDGAGGRQIGCFGC